jgi:hypothetical protein
MENHDYASVKALNNLRYYILHSKISYVPTSTIKDIITQPNNEGRRGKLIANIQGYDMEIKPTKLVEGKGQAKPLVESNCKVLDLNALSTNIIATKSEEDETREPSLEVMLSPNIGSLPLNWGILD